MVDFKVKFTPTKSFHEKISLPQMRVCTQLVRAGRRRPDPKMSMWSYALFISGVRGRYYRDALRCACSRCDSSCERDEDTEVSYGSQEFASTYDTDGGHSQQNWIKGKRNGITRCDIDGQRIARTSRGEKRVARWVDLETHGSSSKTIESRQHKRSR